MTIDIFFKNAKLGVMDCRQNKDKFDTIEEKGKKAHEAEQLLGQNELFDCISWLDSRKCDIENLWIKIIYDTKTDKCDFER